MNWWLCGAELESLDIQIPGCWMFAPKAFKGSLHTDPHVGYDWRMAWMSSKRVNPSFDVRTSPGWRFSTDQNRVMQVASWKLLVSPMNFQAFLGQFLVHAVDLPLLQVCRSVGSFWDPLDQKFHMSFIILVVTCLGALCIVEGVCLFIPRYTRWWFQTFHIFTPILGVSWSNLTHIFQMGGSTTNQYMFAITPKWSSIKCRTFPSIKCRFQVPCLSLVCPQSAKSMHIFCICFFCCCFPVP